MAKYKVTMGLGFAGYTGTDYFEADSIEEAEDIAYELTIQHAEAYGFEQNEDYFGDLDGIGRRWREDVESELGGYYEMEGRLDWGLSYA